MKSKIIAVIASIYILLVLGSCGKDEPKPPIPTPEDVERVTVVYAVNVSNLSEDFISDREEMEKGLLKANNPNAPILLYCTPYKGNPVLYESVICGDSIQWKERFTYNYDVTSTDPQRIKKVLEDAISLYSDVGRTLIFWGHGSSWAPSFTNHTPRSGIVSGAPSDPFNAYGGEYGKDGSTYTELDDLALAVPDDSFDTIWFDCCYMSSVEVAYQFRNKCRWFVAYPTEVWQYGLNYDGIIPYLQKETPDLVNAAQSFYNFYVGINLPVTVSVMDMTKIEPLAQSARDIILSYPVPGSLSQVVNYGRFGYQFYDFLQEMRARCNNEDMIARLQSSLNDFIVYHAATSVNFNKVPWISQPISGISTHHFSGGTSREENYYRTLDWYKRVYE